MTEAIQDPPPSAPDPAQPGSPAGAWNGVSGGPYPQDVAWPAAPAPPRRPGRAAAVAAGMALVVAALGAPLGLLWAVVAPSVPVRMTADGALLVETQPEEFVAADGWFTLLGAGFGALVAIAVWLLFRGRRGPLMLVAVTVGAVAAGLLAWWAGRQVGLSEYERLLADAPRGTVFGKPADLRSADAELRYGFLPLARGAVLVPAMAAAVVYTLLAGWSRFPTLREHEERHPYDWEVAERDAWERDAAERDAAERAASTRDSADRDPSERKPSTIDLEAATEPRQPATPPTDRDGAEPAGPESTEAAGAEAEPAVGAEAEPGEAGPREAAERRRDGGFSSGSAATPDRPAAPAPPAPGAAAPPPD